MQVYRAPVQDMMFCLESHGYDAVRELSEEYAGYDLETVESLLEEAGKFCAAELLPLNRVGDKAGVVFQPETNGVKTPDGFPAAYRKLVENGLVGISEPQEYGGGGAPKVIGTFLSEIVTATNKSFSMAPGLSHGLIEALQHYGTDEQKATYLGQLIDGRFTGTMCLTEPQCGTDLGLIRTKAVPDGDGGYLLSGTKIWITFGEHDLTDNIIHLVLARLPDAPEGIKGISAFMVPKLNSDGSRNGIYCTGLEHKMGIHASPTCVMTLEDARGSLVGEPNKGMRAMFVMMNSARLGVGLEGVGLGEIAYQTAVAFAKDRRQSRSLDPSKQDASAPADNILVHADVRRMLANIRVTTEGLRGLATWISILYDLSLRHPDEKKRQEADDLVALLTPIMKAYGTDRGCENVSEAMQVCGGSGYTTDWSIEQYYRDLRIARIYEGTNHIQALDLVGRKLPRGGGRLLMRFGALAQATIAEAAKNPALAGYAKDLGATMQELQEVTMGLMAKAGSEPETVGAIANNYLNLMAIGTLGYIWLRQLLVVGEREGAFFDLKRKSGHYFFKMVLPERHTYAALVKEGNDSIAKFAPDDF
jgi:alkylation response protein AidB-like acyl-CoA dehydrogenase